MWISVHSGINGPKLRSMQKQLSCSKFEATGILVYFWLWGLENAEKDGHIPHADRDDIEECIRGSNSGCSIDTSRIVDALVDCGWLESRGKEFYIHDWEEWQEQWYKAKERRERDAKRKRESRKRELFSYEDYGEEQEIEKHEDGKESAKKQKEEKSDSYSEGFLKFWDVYPRKVGKADAYKKYKTRTKDGWSEEELVAAAKNYSIQCKKQKTEPQYIKHPKTFLSDTTPFVDYLPKRKENNLEIHEQVNPFADYGGD